MELDLGSGIYIVFKLNYTYEYLFKLHSLFLYYPNFYICRLYGATIVCYHAFYLPLLYVTFLADFFQVIIIIILQSLLDVLLLPFTSFVPFLLFVTSCFCSF